MTTPLAQSPPLPCSVSSDGGPAFPTKREALDPRATGWSMQEGMTLRDYFAAKALAGMFSNPALIDTFSHHEMMAEEAFHVADAMLASGRNNA